MLKKIDHVIACIENTMLIFGMLSTTFILFVNVIMRYFFNSGIVWSNEYANFAIIWIVIGGCGAAVRTDAHMKITAIPDSINNEKAKALFDLFVCICSAVFSAVLLIYGGKLVMSMIENDQRSAAMEIPLWTIYLSFPVGGAAMLFRYLMKLVLTIQKLAGKGGSES